jgi:hypothetical protein
LINNLKSIGNVAKIVLFSVWIFSIIGLVILGLRQATQQAYDGEFITEQVLPVQSGDTLNLAMITNNRFDYNTRRSGHFSIRLDENNEKIIYSRDVRLIVRSTQDSVGKIYLEKKAEGKSFIDAKSRAEAINYDYSYSNNTLSLNGFFTTDAVNKYREQEVEVVVYLPEGVILFADKNTYSYHRNYSRYGDILDNGDEGHYLLIKREKTYCLDCPDKMHIEYNSEDSDWEFDLNNKLDDEDDNHIIIDKNGLDINITDKEDTIRVKIGN